MKETKPLIVLASLVGLIFAGWWLKSHKSDAASPTALLQRLENRMDSRQSGILNGSSILIRQTLRIEPNRASTFNFIAPIDRVPGFLSGEWKSVGKSAGIAGARDDTIIAFKLIGPDKKIIEMQDHHPVAGSFKIRIDKPGQYTFNFDNSGIVRSSAREVRVDGSYQPD